MSDLLRVKFGDDLSVTRECEFIHAYIMGGTDHRLAPHYLGHLGEVIWFNHATQTVVCQSVTVGERSEVVLPCACYECGEAIALNEWGGPIDEYNEIAEIVDGCWHAIAHVHCALTMVDIGKYELA